MRRSSQQDLKRENRIFIASFAMAALGIALRVTELAGVWGAA